MILVVGLMVVLWLVASHLEMQRALQWWFKRQSLKMMDQSEQIHNGVLQDLFAVRRSLELASANENPISTTQRQTWLNQAEKIHYSLEQISDFLTPPYLAESLALALQMKLKDWQLEHPGWTVSHTLDEALNPLWTGELTQPWTSATPEQNRIILEVLGEFLCLVSPIALTSGSLNISAQPQGEWNELVIQIDYPDRSTMQATMQNQELKYLRRVFQGLTGGRCFYVKHNFQVVWHFCWKVKGIRTSE